MLHWATYIGLTFSNDISRLLLERSQLHLAAFDSHVAWHPIAYLHLTLHFLGWLQPEKVQTVTAVLGEYQNNAKSLVLKPTKHIVFLGWEAKNEYIALEIGPMFELTQLRNQLDKRLIEAGVEAKRQPFLPHITLGRVYKGENFQNTQIPIEEIAFSAERLGLFESIPASRPLA
jgi:2'-5' RNA ligase